MPTDKQRVSIVLDDDVFEQLEEYRYSNRIPSLSKAALNLIRLGLDHREEPVLSSDTESVSITLDKQLAKDVLNYQINSNADSFSRAACVLLHYGLIGEEVRRGDLDDPHQHALTRNELLLLSEYLAGAQTGEKQEYILSLVRSFKQHSTRFDSLYDDKIHGMLNSQQEIIDKWFEDVDITDAHEA